MADALDISRVVALSDAALSLERKGYYVRAAAKYGAALEAAQALAQPDCLVVASLHLCCVNALTYVVSEGEHAEVISATASVFEHQDAALATLRRRLDAKTLLGGCCRPYEVA